MPPGGDSFLAEMTCNSGILWYNHDTLEWDVDFAPGWRIGLTHTVDPYWGRDGRLRAEEKITAAPVGGSKIGSEKPPSNPGNANSENRNSKWSWMRRSPGIGRKIHRFG